MGTHDHLGIMRVSIWGARGLGRRVSGIRLTLNYQNLLVCRVPTKIYAMRIVIRTYRKEGYGRLR